MAGSALPMVLLLVGVFYAGSQVPAVTQPLQHSWASLVHSYDADALVVWGSFLIFVCTYWSVGLLYLVVDIWHAPRVVWDTRFQRPPKRDFCINGGPFNPSLGKTVLNALGNQLFVFLPGIWALHVGSRALGFGVVVSDELPSVSDIAWSAIKIMPAVSWGFYWSHRLLHVPSLYRFHKPHHNFRKSIALAAIYSHPVEALVSSVCSIIGPAFFLNTHLATIYVGMALGWAATTRGHSGYGFMGQDRSHDLHHSKNTGNFGNTGVLDWVFGTQITPTP